MRPILATGLTFLFALPAFAQDAGIEFFEKKIRPVLAEHCYSCHSVQAKKVKGKLLLDSRDDARKGGETGPAVVPGKLHESLLIKAIRFTDPELKMPPKGKLPAQAIADLETWVTMGAPDPRVKGATTEKASTWEEMLKTRRTWWSLQPVRKPTVPMVKNAAWSNDPVDRFLLHQLEAKGLTPAGEADPRTLIRRWSLVLTGLPPSPAEVSDFTREFANAKMGAVEKLVDRLLDSPHFGERWARHWMDVVRFSETHGNEWNYDVHHAWRYRDYLIRAFNEDIPFDQFVREHIAGDLLPKPRWNQKEKFNESVIGTAFYRFGEVNHDDCIDLPQIPYDLFDNQIDTLTKAFQATTVACARCHDHKIDAVSMKDYYGLLGILRSSRQVAHTIDAPEVNRKALEGLLKIKDQIRKELGAVWLEDAKLVSQYLRAAQARLEKSEHSGELAKGLNPSRLERLAQFLKGKSESVDDPLEPWRRLTQDKDLKPALKEFEQDFFRQKDQDLKELIISESWQIKGQGLRGGRRAGGDFVVQIEGDQLVRYLLNDGFSTHSVSSRLNGAMRLPLLSGQHKFISFLVLGQAHSAVRLVSNNCQLNYRNFKALSKDELHWVTFPIPENPENLGVYVELMTKFDNPKFPDQLGTLGGDTSNQRVPWEKAAANPHSFFGIFKVVLHNEPSPPKWDARELLYWSLLRIGNRDAMADHYQEKIRFIVESWMKQKEGTNFGLGQEKVRWVNEFLRTGLLTNQISASPKLKELVKEYRRLESTLALPRIVPGMDDFGPGVDQPVFVRGDCTKPGEPTPRRYLEVLARPGERFTTKGSGRLELAEKIASAENPLTARVFVNRVWHHLFGTGLVRSVDDFGRVGDLPSHPELLDYLAARFVEEGWSMKKLIRALVLTRTFQQGNQPSPNGKEVDPENRLLHHYPARRLEAEGIRDAILAASGRLDTTLFGLSVHSYRDKDNADRRLFAGPLDGNGRRSLYIKNTLMEAPRFLGVFDFPGGKYTQGRRDVTNVPAQALALLNDPFVLQQAEVWAKRLVARNEDTPAARIEAMFHTALSRPPTAEESRRFGQALVQFAELHGVPPGEILANVPVWKDLAHAIFNLKEFIYIR